MKVKAGSGLMIESKGKTWHLGETVANTPQGKRHITHLQSLSAPSHHFYFDRNISDQETAEIVTAAGRPGLSDLIDATGKPKLLSVPGQVYTAVRNKVQGIKTPSRQTYSGLRKPHQIEGYVGEVYTIENLMPLWGSLKKAMITTRLYHPPQETRWVTTRRD